MSPEVKAARDLRRHLRDLTTAVLGAMAAVDAVSVDRNLEPVERGRRIARVLNALEVANDLAMHFGLGETFAKINRRKKLRAVAPPVTDHETVGERLARVTPRPRE